MSSGSIKYQQFNNGEWHTIEQRFAEDGTMRVWVDGAETVAHDGVVLAERLPDGKGFRVGEIAFAPYEPPTWEERMSANAKARAAAREAAEHEADRQRQEARRERLKAALPDVCPHNVAPPEPGLAYACPIGECVCCGYWFPYIIGDGGPGRRRDGVDPESGRV